MDREREGERERDGNNVMSVISFSSSKRRRGMYPGVYVSVLPPAAGACAAGISKSARPPSSYRQHRIQ